MRSTLLVRHEGGQMRDNEVSNSVLLEEIRLNRASITRVGDKVSGKVGRTELVGWLSVVAILVGLFASFTA